VSTVSEVDAVAWDAEICDATTASDDWVVGGSGGEDSEAGCGVDGWEAGCDGVVILTGVWSVTVLAEVLSGEGDGCE